MNISAILVVLVFGTPSPAVDVIPQKFYGPSKTMDCLMELRQMQKKYPNTYWDCVIVRSKGDVK
jgi:hypothetical protein